MNNLDFNDAPEQQDEFSLIPDNTFAKIIMIIRSDGEDALTQSKSSEAKMLNCEFTVLDGQFQNRKFWQNLVISGGKQDKNGNSIAGNISKSLLRAILESYKNIMPNDTSKEAIVARQVSSFWVFNEMEFVGKIRIRKAQKNSKYGDKNELALVVTPNRPEYRIVMSGQEVEAKPTVFKKTEATPVVSKAKSSWGNSPEQSTVVSKTPNKSSWGNSPEQSTVKEETPSQGDVPLWAK